MKNLYLLVDLGAFIVPFLFSFYPTINFHRQWRAALPAIFLTAGLFIAWDVVYTQKGIWGFNPAYITGLHILNLPVEEVLFFICIPYSCLFTYHCFKIFWFRENTVKRKLLITNLAVALLVLIALLNYERWYTVVSFFLLALCLLYASTQLQKSYSHFMLTNAVLILPFLVVNGILTGTGIDHEVVWYNQSHILGLRVMTIPVEDFIYGASLILINMMLFEKLSARK